MPSRVRIRRRSTSNSATVARMLKNILPIGIGRVVDLPAEREPDASAGVVVADRAGVGYPAGQPIQLRHDEGVARADGGEGQVEAGALTVDAGQAVVEVEPVIGYTELTQPAALRGEVLVVGGAAGEPIRTPVMIGL